MLGDLATAVLQAGSGPMVETAARLRRLERRVDALAARCDARLSAVESRWQSLPPAAGYDPFALPTPGPAAPGAGADGETPSQRRRAQGRQPPRRADGASDDPLGLGAQLASAVLQGAAANAKALVQAGRAVGAVLPPLGVLGALVEQAMARLPAPASDGVGAGGRRGASGSASGGASGGAAGRRKNTTGADAAAPLPESLVAIVQAAAAALRAPSAGGIAAAATQVVQAAGQAVRAGSNAVAGSLTGGALGPAIGRMAGQGGVLQPVAASMLLQAQLQALAALAGQAVAGAARKPGRGGASGPPAPAAAAAAIGAALAGATAAPRAASRLLAPKAGTAAPARGEREAPVPGKAAGAEEEPGASDALAALNKMLIDQAWLRGVDLR